MRVGETNIEIGGKLRKAKFGTNQSAEYCRVRGISMSKMQEELTSLNEDNGSCIRDLIYSALFAGAKKAKEEIDFDNYDVGDWADEMKENDLIVLLKALTDSQKSGSVEDAPSDGKK